MAFKGATLVLLLTLWWGSAVMAHTAPRRLLRSGYFGIHVCTLPTCDDYTQLVGGTMGQAPYALSVQADVVRNQIYWLPVDLSTAHQYGIGAAFLDSGKPAHGGQYIWIPSDNQLRLSVFDPIQGLYYFTNSSNALFSFNPDSAVATFVVQFKASVYNNAFIRNRVIYMGGYVNQTVSCVYQYALDSRASSESILACNPTVPIPNQPAVLAGGAQHLYVADPNDDHAVVLDYAGASHVL